jgi:hypothetical protein
MATGLVTSSYGSEVILRHPIHQCCGSGSGIRNPVPFLSLDPGSGIGKENQDPDPEA